MDNIRGAFIATVSVDSGFSASPSLQLVVPPGQIFVGIASGQLIHSSSSPPRLFLTTGQNLFCKQTIAYGAGVRTAPSVFIKLGPGTYTLQADLCAAGSLVSFGGGFYRA